MTQDEYVSFCAEFIKKHGSGPTPDQTMKQFDCSRASAYQVLSDARKQGRITMPKGDYGSMKVVGRRGGSKSLVDEVNEKLSKVTPRARRAAPAAVEPVEAVESPLAPVVLRIDRAQIETWRIHLQAVDRFLATALESRSVSEVLRGLADQVDLRAPTGAPALPAAPAPQRRSRRVKAIEQLAEGGVSGDAVATSDDLDADGDVPDQPTEPTGDEQHFRLQQRNGDVVDHYPDMIAARRDQRKHPGAKVVRNVDNVVMG